MLARCVALIVLSAALAFADEVALCRVGDLWSYLPASSASGAEAKTWAEHGFDDSGWLRGRSGFSAGYASAEATAIPDPGIGGASVLFRRVFTLKEPDSVKWLTLRMDYSHGFVAYLNGREIARRNLEGASGIPVPFTAGATNYHVRGEPEAIDVTHAAQLLVKGENVLAVQLHRDLSRPTLCLSPELLANFTRGPFLQNMSSNQVQIVWRTPVPSQTQVAYGTNLVLDTELTDSRLVTTHVATLTGLAPDTTYYYEARSYAEGKTAVFGPASFRTFKTAGSVRFVAVGDGGWNSLAQYDIARVVRESRADLVLQNGDNVYPAFTDWLADPRCFSVYQPHMAGTPHFFAIGNHDLYSGPGHYLEAFYLPTNSVSLAEHAAAGTSPEHYYSFDHGDAHFTVLYVPFLSQHQVVPGDPQFRWLTNDLASTSKPWKIVVFHVPMNSSSAHRYDDMNYNGVPDRIDISGVLLPVLSQYGVQLVLSGHEHGYERFNPVEGVHGITTAGGGVTLYGFSQLDPASAYYASRYNCVRVSIDRDVLQAEALGTAGEVFDRMTICRALPSSQTYQAEWYAPAFPDGQPHDGDGNVVGQVFDFRGEPIPSLSGRFSNLGRTFVSHDGAYLYIGLEQVMIYADSSIFLFLESPRLPGVASLEDVGNGRIDPEGQGADGLDFLSDLSFSGFHPSIACILGDEFADGQFRSFRRRNSLLDTGQGVFRLDAGLTSVPGVWLQQFHSSPQSVGLLDEENANFIQAAIPLAELGGVQPGDVIRIGAVVVGRDTAPATQARALDSGFLGAHLVRDERGRAVLEGASVLLRDDAETDEDNDGLTRSNELVLGTDPTRADSDGDTLPDGWEVGHGLNPLSNRGEHGSAGDPDEDGAANAHEWLAGTDPRSGRSVFRLSFERIGIGGVRISWPAAAGRRYQIEMSADPSAGFVDLDGGELSASAVSTNLGRVLNLGDPREAASFYRVRIVTGATGP